MRVSGKGITPYKRRMILMLTQDSGVEDLIMVYEDAIQNLSKYAEFPLVREMIRTIRFAVLCMKHPDKAQALTKG